jgi:hypothetical protein
LAAKDKDASSVDGFLLGVYLSARVDIFSMIPLNFHDSLVLPTLFVRYRFPSAFRALIIQDEVHRATRGSITPLRIGIGRQTGHAGQSAIECL